MGQAGRRVQITGAALHNCADSAPAGGSSRDERRKCALTPLGDQALCRVLHRKRVARLVGQAHACRRRRVEQFVSGTSKPGAMAWEGQPAPCHGCAQVRSGAACTCAGTLCCICIPTHCPAPTHRPHRCRRRSAHSWVLPGKEGHRRWPMAPLQRHGQRQGGMNAADNRAALCSGPYSQLDAVACMHAC